MLGSKMSLHLPFVAAVAATLHVEIEKVGTACTNGSYVKFDPDFCVKLTDPELMFLYAHETMHKALLHPWRRGTRNPALWNMACDYVINLLLYKMHTSMLKMPKVGLLDLQFDDMSEEQVYDKLVQSGMKVPSNFSIDLIDNNERTAADAEVEVINIATASKMAGVRNGLIDLILGNAGKSTVRWEDVLRSFVTNNVRSGQTWRRRSRRSSDIYLPTLRSKVMNSIVLFGDVSGSMMELVQKITNEMQGIIDDVSPEVTHVFCGDTAVTFSGSFPRGTRINIPLKGGGGTDFRPLFSRAELLDTAPDCGVFLTDTDGTFPATPPAYPVLWGVLRKGHISVPWGEVVRIV